MSSLTPKRPMSALQFEALEHLAEFPDGVTFFPILACRGLKRTTLRALVRRGLVRMDFDTRSTLTEAGLRVLAGEDEEGDL